MHLNPKFTFFSPIRTTVVDAEQLGEHVDHAIIALDARAPVGGGLTIEQLNPVLASATLRVELWVNDLRDFTCTYGFVVSSEDGRVPFARGERTVVNVDPVTQRAAKWDRQFVLAHHELLKDLPAYA